MSEIQAHALPPGDPALESEWRRLEQAGGVSSPFQTWSWFSAIKDHPDLFGDLTVIAAFQNEVAIGLLAIEIVKSRWRMRTLQIPGQDWIDPDHVDVIATEEHRSTAARAIADWIIANRGWDVLDLDGLRPTSPLVSALHDGRRLLTQLAQTLDVAKCPQLRLEADRDPLESRSQSARKKIRRDLKRLEVNGGSTGEITQSADASRAALEFTAHMVRERFGANGLLFNSDERFEFISDLVERLRTAGQLRWFTTRLEDELLATDAVLAHNGQFHTYMGVRSDSDILESPGTINLLTILRTAGAEGCLDVDLLRGDHPWKQRVATGQIVDVRVRIARPRARTGFEFAARKLAHSYSVLNDRSRGSYPNLRSRVDSAIERRVLDIQRARVLTLSLESATHEPPRRPSEVRITRLVGEESDDSEWRAAFGSEEFESIRQQRSRGDTCYAAWIGNSVASYLWISTTPHRDPYSGIRVNLRGGEAYIYDVRTVADAQRRGLARLLLQLALAEMEPTKITTVHAVVDNWNTASLRLFRSLGFESSGSVTSARILGRYAIQIPATARPRTSLCSAAHL
ncbi:MAG: GNAT family N-acetyltransferase [Actinomycetia bacterium]|nr:GNAT family N-acetyltransferase [Actinomycetes bacterium]